MRCVACGAMCNTMEWRSPEFDEWKCENRKCGKIWTVRVSKPVELARTAELEVLRRRQEDAEQSPTEKIITGCVVIAVIVGLFVLLPWCGSDNSAKCERFPELCVDYPVDDDPRH